MIRIIVFFFSFVMMIGITNAQSYYFSDKNISLKLDLSKKNDSLLVKRTIVNKTNNNLYIPAFGGVVKHNEVWIDSADIVIKLGVFTRKFVVETPAFLNILKAQDTIVASQLLYFENIEIKDKVIIEFDYLNIAQFDKKVQKKIQNEIGLLNDKSFVQPVYIMFRSIYRQHCELFTIIVPYNR